MIARNFKGTFRVGLVSLAALCMAGQAHAADEALTRTNTEMLDKITVVDGKTIHELVNPSVTHDKVVPGSPMVMVYKYHNNLTQPITNFVYIDPVPTEWMLSQDSAAEFDVSVDGGKTFGKLADLVVTDAKGSRRAAEASDVTTVRKVIPVIAAGASGTIEYHAVIR